MYPGLRKATKMSEIVQAQKKKNRLCFHKEIWSFSFFLKPVAFLITLLFSHFLQRNECKEYFTLPLLLQEKQQLKYGDEWQPVLSLTVRETTEWLAGAS